MDILKCQDFTLVIKVENFLKCCLCRYFKSQYKVHYKNNLQECKCSEKQNVIVIINKDKKYSIKLLLHNHFMVYKTPIATLAAAIVSLS